MSGLTAGQSAVVADVVDEAVEWSDLPLGVYSCPHCGTDRFRVTGPVRQCAKSQIGHLCAGDVPKLMHPLEFDRADLPEKEETT